MSRHLYAEIRRQATIFSDQLFAARTFSCVDGRFSQFLASTLMKEAREACEEDPSLDASVVQALREGFSPVYENCRGWKHALSKPYGYPGDFALLEVVYNQSFHPETRDNAAQLIDQWATSTTLPRSVRGRKDALRVYLEDFLRKFREQGRVARVLSLASGAAREVREIHPDLLAAMDLTLLDADARSLDFARRSLEIESPAKVRYVTENLFLWDAESYFQEEQPFDLIYSFGLFDYLDDRNLLQCLRRYSKFLSPRGNFVFSLKDRRFYDAWFYHWSMDWVFVPRIAEDGLRCAEQAGLAVVESYQVEGRAVSIYVCRS